MKMRKSPCTPLRVKAKGKEISRYIFSSSDYRGRACATRVRARRGANAFVAAAVEKALIAFNGTRGPKPSDEAIWAAIAWRIGATNFYHAVVEKMSEDNADGVPRNPAAAFQRFLDRRYPRNGGAK